MKAVLSYAGVSALLLVLLALGVVGLVEAAEPAGVWLAAMIAWPVQVAAFWALVAGRRTTGAGSGFMLAWAAGMALRFGVVGAVALWVTRMSAPDPATTLLSLVGFVFVLVLLEPLFLRLAD